MDFKETPVSPTPAALHAGQRDMAVRERHSGGGQMDALQVTRRLQKIAGSIESFLSNHTQRLSSAVDSVRQSESQTRAALEAMESFVAEREAWEQEKAAEIVRLNEASAKLIDGWKELETERRKWLGEKTQHVSQNTSPVVAQNRVPTQGAGFQLVQQPASAVSSEGPGLDRLELLRREIEKHAGNG
ncbi:MAG: hypothetical protein AAF456_15215 [Planctomycetota bacterium]